MSLTVTVSGADRRLNFSWQAAANSWADSVTPESVALMKARAPFRTGRLRKDIDSKTESSPEAVTVTIYGTASYLPYVLDGTRAHVITPRNAHALRWLGRGGIGENFAKKVNHPGTKPNPFPEEAMGVATPMILSRFADAVREAITVE